jgi:methyl-accepting chemotaxis protein
MAKRKGSLLRQLTLGLGLAIIFLSLASFYYQYLVQRHILTANIREELTSQATMVRSWLARGQTEEQREQIAKQYVETLANTDLLRRQVLIIRSDRTTLASSNGYFAASIVAAAVKPGAPIDGLGREEGDHYVVALPFFDDPTLKTPAGAVLIRQPMTVVGRLIDSLMLGAFILLAVTLIIIVGVVYAVLRIKVHKPMQAIFMQEYRIREGDLARIDAKDPANEFSDLYAMYNEMVVRIAEQKKATLAQKDHVAVARAMRQAIQRLAQPLDDIGMQCQTLLEHESSLAPADRDALRKIVANVTRIVRELKKLVMEGDKSSSLLKQQAEQLRQYDRGDEKINGRYSL